MLTPNKNESFPSHVALGIDIGGTTTKIGVVDRNGCMLHRTAFSTQSCSNGEHFMQQLIRNIDQVLQLLERKIDLIGIGVGAPGGNFYTGCITDAANLNWKGNLNICEALQAVYGVPCTLTNDANLAVLGERQYGAAKGMNSFISISLGTGLGCGIILDGSLVNGKDGLAGELGHTTVKHNGRMCNCGRRGCLETYVSATGIKKTLLKLLSQYGDSTGRWEYASLSDVSAAQITAAAHEGDKLAKMAFEYTGSIFGAKLADVLAYYNPEAIFITGGLANAGALLFKPTIMAMDKYMLSNFRNTVKVLPSALAPGEVSILGAAALVWEYEMVPEEIESTG